MSGQGQGQGLGQGTGQDAEGLRAAFDAGFALPLAERRAGRLALLVVRLGARRVALETGGLLSLERVSDVVAVDSAEPALLGLAGVGGRAVPVFSMARLLGEDGAAMSESWERRPLFALVRVQGGNVQGDEKIGLAFDGLERFVQVEAQQVLTGQAGRTARIEDESFAVTTVSELVARLAAG